MQRTQRFALSPLPDITRNPSAPLRPAHRPTPEFLIIGLFALRLTKRLIVSLDYYPGRDADIIWLVNFLAPYPEDCKLAKISGSRRDDYLAMYQNVVSRMKKQPKYPVRFMQMNPDSSIQQARRGREIERPREMTDSERLDIIDFCDAAAEWGSMLPIPVHEAEKMVELADRRKVADVDEPYRQQSHYSNWEESHGQRQSRFNDRDNMQDQRQSQFAPNALPRDMERPVHEPRQPEREDRYQPHNAGTWRGDEYLIAEGRQLAEDRRRRRRVSFADEESYLDARGMRR
ncbi:hypothetical protein GT037_001839 [Alternaria burnsii]|uniref:Uncharacterized protein n=1 Tax=Alternaria burnsii TaxID=1187904 RepID=A0A8H7BEZ0_9PLEO|nr:uncharacterized protein GT037_001839 [Alternaria burnsii]KAF7680188.1 hypothetical protein GT037_001839 [Alternaria burnsii]CAI9628792.1 unnamed protein product [Alternaria burnsii]